jgi:HEPN domain-containing protein
MELSKKISYWLEISEYDLETAKYMQKSGRYLYTVFTCQQAVEKMLKAIYLQKFGKEAPFTHNLVYIYNLLEIYLTTNEVKLLAVLTAYYIEGRYPSYKKKMSSLIKKEKSLSLLKKSEELLQCLKILIKP